MKKAAVIGVLATLLTLWSCARERTVSNSVSPTSTESTPCPTPTVAPKPTFTVCSGTYALCTSAKCTPTKPTATCLCEVKQGYSAGAKSCDEVPQAPPQPGQTIPSRYHPITNMAVCTRKLSWAMCLDSPCTVNSDGSTANCTCNLVETPEQSFVVTTNSFNSSTCTAATVSSATVNDVIQITGFLQNSPNLKAKPITIVGVDAGTE